MANSRRHSSASCQKQRYLYFIFLGEGLEEGMCALQIWTWRKVVDFLRCALEKQSKAGRQKVKYAQLEAKARSCPREPVPG